MLILKITISLFVLLVVGFIIMKIMIENLSPYEIATKNYPMYMIVIVDIWLLLGIAFVGCLIATIILWQHFIRPGAIYEGRISMTYRERIEELVRLYNYYITVNQQNLNETFNEMINPNFDCDKLYFECAVSALNSQARTFTSPLFEMLRAEDVVSIEKTKDGKTLVVTRYEQFVLDMEMKTPFFMVEIPVQTITRYRSGTEIKNPSDEEAATYE